MDKIILLSLFFLSVNYTYCQTEENHSDLEDDIEKPSGPKTVDGTFSSTRVINGHSAETLYKNILELRIQHRFGDIGGATGGVQTLYGFDNVADMRFGLEYGITDEFMVGFGRSKGTGIPYRSLLDGFGKYKLLKQRETGMPISLAVQAGLTYTYMTKVDDFTLIASFPKWQHRIAYSTQLIATTRIGDRFSLLLAPTIVHRNYVSFDDVNTLFALGTAASVSITPTVAFIVEYYYVLNDDKSFRTDNTNSLGFAIEIETFGHHFTLNFTNSKGFGETQFIPYTFSKWLDGQYRFGFTIGRDF